MHVDDLVNALCTVPVTPEAHIYNVGSGHSHSVGEVAEMVGQASGTAKPIVARGPGRAEEISDAVADISAIRRLGWEPRIGFADGLRRLVAEARRDLNPVI